MEYYNAAGAGVNLPALAHAGTDGAFETLIVTVDTATEQYISVQYAGVTADLAGIAYQDAWAGGDNSYTPLVQIATSNTPPATAYFDNFELWTIP